MTGLRIHNAPANPRDITGTLLAKQQAELRESRKNDVSSARALSIRELFTEEEIISARNDILRERIGD
jgi:hypothetical protein